MADDRERQGRLALAPLARLVLDIPTAALRAVGHQAVGDDATFSQVGLAAALEPVPRLRDECYVARVSRSSQAADEGRCENSR